MMSTLSKTEHLVHRLLFLDPPDEKTFTSTDDTAAAERTFGFSLLFSGLRCILQYVIFPFILPIVGVSLNAAMPVLLAINLLAMFLIVFSVRRFWRINYKYKWQYLPIAGVALLILTAFIVLDISTLLGQ